jgi:hypothetical protein
VNLALIGPIGIPQLPYLPIQLTQLMRIPARASNPTAHRLQHIINRRQLNIKFLDLFLLRINPPLMFRRNLQQPQLQLLRMFPLLELINLNEHFLELGLNEQEVFGELLFRLEGFGLLLEVEQGFSGLELGLLVAFGEVLELGFLRLQGVF